VGGVLLESDINIHRGAIVFFVIAILIMIKPLREHIDQEDSKAPELLV